MFLGSGMIALSASGSNKVGGKTPDVEGGQLQILK